MESTDKLFNIKYIMDQTLTSNRKSIFNRSSSRIKSRSKKFESFSKTALPKFIYKLDDCGCTDSVSVCPYVFSIINKDAQPYCEQKYQQIKRTVQQESIERTPFDHKFYIPKENKIFIPHLRNLLKIIDPISIEPIMQILRHAKTQYATFWIFAKLCEKWPQRNVFKSNIKEIALKNSMDIDFEDQKVQTKMDHLYESKLACISDNNYLKVVKLIVRQSRFAEKMAALSLIAGRQRIGNQIINATIDHDSQL